MRFAIKTRPEHTPWARIRDVWLAADEISLFESAWNWDHFYPLTGDLDRAEPGGVDDARRARQATRRIRVGCQVTGMIYRHPRCWRTWPRPPTSSPAAGWNWAWAPAGTRWNATPTASTCRRCGSASTGSTRAWRRSSRLLSQETTTLNGRYVRLTDARCEPKPVQRPHPPITIGGRGKTRTLRTAARWAQQWNAITQRPAGLARPGRDARRPLRGARPRSGRDHLLGQRPGRGRRPHRQAAELAAAYRDAGADLAIMNLPLAADPGHARARWPRRWRPWRADAPGPPA